MSETPKLTVETAAIRDSKGTVHSLPRPARHNDVIRKMREEGIDEVIPQDGQGFLLSNGMFARRRAALGVAARARQTSRDKCVNPGVGLFSEDLW